MQLEPALHHALTKIKATSIPERIMMSLLLGNPN